MLKIEAHVEKRMHRERKHYTNECYVQIPRANQNTCPTCEKRGKHKQTKHKHVFKKKQA